MSSIEYINSVVLTSAQSSVTFSAIPTNYNDLKIVLEGTYSSGGVDNVFIKFNSDSTTSYSYTLIYGTGSAAASTRGSNSTSSYIGQFSTVAGQMGMIEVDVFSYINTNVFKTVLASSSVPEYRLSSWVNLWRSTAAINSIEISGSTTFAAGSTFTLWGVK